MSQTFSPFLRMCLIASVLGNSVLASGQSAISFGPLSYLDPGHSIDDVDDNNVSITTDGNGVWLAVWSSRNYGRTGGDQVQDGGILFRAAWIMGNVVKPKHPEQRRGLALARDGPRRTLALRVDRV